MGVTGGLNGRKEYAVSEMKGLRGVEGRDPYARGDGISLWGDIELAPVV